MGYNSGFSHQNRKSDSYNHPGNNSNMNGNYPAYKQQAPIDGPLSNGYYNNHRDENQHAHHFIPGGESQAPQMQPRYNSFNKAAGMAGAGGYKDNDPYGKRNV